MNTEARRTIYPNSSNMYPSIYPSTRQSLFRSPCHKNRISLIRITVSYYVVSSASLSAQFSFFVHSRFAPTLPSLPLAGHYVFSSAGHIALLSIVIVRLWPWKGKAQIIAFPFPRLRIFLPIVLSSVVLLLFKLINIVHNAFF
jgi:hypothetical protein